MSKDKQPEIRFPGFTDEWEQRKLGEVVESVGTGRSTFTNGIVQTSETPYAVLGSTSVISYDSMFDHSGDFILTARVGANAGNLYKYFGEVKISDNTVYIQANNLDFIYYLLTKYDLKRLSFGTGQPLVKASEVKNLKLNFPQKNEEQQKIGSFFKQLDDTIALHQRKLDLLKETKKGFLQKMFPKNGAKAPEIRFSGFTEDWEQRKLGEIVQITMGQSPNSENYTENPEDYILVQGNADMKNNRVVPRVWTTQITKQAEKGDLILSVRAPVGDIGKTDYDVVLGRGVAAIKGNDFIFQQLGKMKESGYWNRFSTGSTFESINSNDIREALITIPTGEEQQKIGTFFQQLDDTIALHQRKLDLLKETKKGFLQKMFV